MKKFKFSMQSILDVNLTLRDVAMSEVAEVTHRLNLEQEELKRILQLIEAQMDSDHMPVANSASFLLQREKYLKRLRDLKLNQERDIEATKRMVEKAKNKLRQAFIEVKKMEKARERQQAKWGYELNSEEQGINDEIGTTRHFFSTG